MQEKKNEGVGQHTDYFIKNQTHNRMPDFYLANPHGPIKPEALEYLIQDNGRILSKKELKQSLLAPITQNHESEVITIEIFRSLEKKEQQIIAYLINRKIFSWRKNTLHKTNTSEKISKTVLDEITNRLDKVIARYKFDCQEECPIDDGLYLASDGFNIEEHASVIAAFLGGITTIIWGMREISGAKEAVKLREEMDNMKKQLKQLSNTKSNETPLKKTEQIIDKIGKKTGMFDYKSSSFAKNLYGPTIIGMGALILGLSIHDLTQKSED